MQITEVTISVKAAATRPGPVPYSSDVREAYIALKAAIVPGEDPAKATAELWTLADAEIAKQNLIVAEKTAKESVAPGPTINANEIATRMAELVKDKSIPDEAFRHLIALVKKAGVRGGKATEDWDKVPLPDLVAWMDRYGLRPAKGAGK